VLLLASFFDEQRCYLFYHFLKTSVTRSGWCADEVAWMLMWMIYAIMIRSFWMSIYKLSGKLKHKSNAYCLYPWSFVQKAFLVWCVGSSY